MRTFSDVRKEIAEAQFAGMPLPFISLSFAEADAILGDTFPDIKREEWITCVKSGKAKICGIPVEIFD